MLDYSLPDEAVRLCRQRSSLKIGPSNISIGLCHSSNLHHSHKTIKLQLKSVSESPDQCKDRVVAGDGGKGDISA